SPHSFCLNNKPQQLEYLKFPNVLPGERYDVDLQCKLQFGTRSKLCKLYHEKNDVLQEHNVCKSLWCQKRGRECATNFMPAAEGTSCGRNMWCRRGRCVVVDTNGIRPVNGGWGFFSAWSPCSKTCGGGIAFKQRYCDRPKPRNFGRNCQGKDRVYQVCNQEPCLQRSADLQAEQCQTFNNRTFSGKRFLWEPYDKDLGALYRCKIYCTPQKADISLVLSTKLSDGVSCKPGFSAVCVDGECKKVGCDGIIDSMVQPDVCGICDGDNSTCRLIAGQLKIQRNISGYYTIAQIPKHARSIKISEVNESPSYLALRNLIGHYYITGHWTIDWPGRYRVAATEFLYRRWYKQPESLQAEGPTNEDLIVEALLHGGEMTVKFSFVLDNEVETYNTDTELRQSMRKHYKWRLVTSPCSVSCGAGFRYQNYSCFDEMVNLVANDLCGSSTEQSLFQITQCNFNSCPPTWETGKWGSCSRSCGIGLRHRHVKCVRKINATTTEKLPSRFCRGQRKPARKEKCSHSLCSVQWATGSWTKCSVSCGEGRQTRNATCVIRRQDNNTNDALFSHHFFSRHVDTINCNFILRPVTTRSCFNNPCPILKPIVENCVDLYTWCHLVVKYKVCSHDFYSKKCCSSCI
ncbi:A disintegrin and metalloproteinase with thrombospondin motifs 18-like, partial [Limulus polyphemus]|uniref:A disintegrin and metalloproteinase with thrombospondin motifs 18-like n=1 Tax=Limulus polyphemus TaxID=6850 RepID=A0ABM1BYP5_LIMPO